MDGIKHERSKDKIQKEGKEIHRIHEDERKN
jgi:hypothetical protein